MYKKILTIASLLIASSFGQPNFAKAQPQLDHENLKTEVSNDVAVIRFSGHITRASIFRLEHYFTIVGSQFKEVLLIINSVGGNNSATDDAINYIKEIPIKITAYTTANVISNAIPLYCVADKKLATKNSQFMVHYGHSSNERINFPQDLERIQNTANDVMKRIENYITECSDYTVDEIKSQLYDEKNNYKINLSGNEAKNKGIVDEIKTPTNLLKKACFFASITSIKKEGKPNYINDEVTNHCTK